MPFDSNEPFTTHRVASVAIVFVIVFVIIVFDLAFVFVFAVDSISIVRWIDKPLFRDICKDQILPMIVYACKRKMFTEGIQK